MITNLTYPSDELQAAFFQMQYHILACNPMMAHPAMWNEDSKKIFNSWETNRLGATVQINAPHYFQSQNVNSFVGTDVNSVVSQKLVAKTLPVTLGKQKIEAKFELSNNNLSWTHQRRKDYLYDVFRNVNRGLMSDVATKKFNNSIHEYRNTNQIYHAFVDRVNDVATPYLKSNDAQIASNPFLAPDKYNFQTLSGQLARIKRVLGDEYDLSDGAMGRVNIMSNTLFHHLSQTQANTFTEPLTMKTFENAFNKDLFRQFGSERFSLADYKIMDNDYAVNNNQWLLPSVTSTGTQGANNGGTAAPFVMTLTAFNIDANGNATGTITCPQSIAGNQLAYGDVFFFKNTQYKFLRANGYGSTATVDLCLVLAQPDGFDENNPSTWFYTAGAGGTVYTVKFVGQFRPITNVGGNIVPANNDPNINVVVNVVDTNTTTINTALSTALTGSVLIPLCGEREHCLTFKTRDHYEFFVNPELVQPYASIPFGDGELRDTYMKFIEWTGDLGVQKSMPIVMAAQFAWAAQNTIGKPDTQNLFLSFAATTFFNNYQLNQGAIALVDLSY